MPISTASYPETRIFSSTTVKSLYLQTFAFWAVVQYKLVCYQHQWHTNLHYATTKKRKDVNYITVKAWNICTFLKTVDYNRESSYTHINRVFRLSNCSMKLHNTYLTELQLLHTSLTSKVTHPPPHFNLKHISMAETPSTMCISQCRSHPQIMDFDF